MRLTLVLALLLALVTPARAEDEPRRPTWYAGWGLIVVGGASSFAGTALTTQSSSDRTTAGWVMLGAGTAIWISGALLLKFTHKGDKPDHLALALRY